MVSQLKALGKRFIFTLVSKKVSCMWVRGPAGSLGAVVGLRWTFACHRGGRSKVWGEWFISHHYELHDGKGMA
jgi:hypothetical protein